MTAQPLSVDEPFDDADSDPGYYSLRLYVAGHTAKSTAAMSNLRRVCETGGLSSGALGLIGHGVGGNSDQPGCERSAAPFIVPQVREGFVENVRGQIFGCVPVAYAPGDKRIDPLKVNFIEMAKVRRVPLRGFDERALVRVFPGNLRRRSSDGHYSSDYITAGE